MKKFLFPILMLLVGIGGGVGAAVVLAPEPDVEAEIADEIDEENGEKDLYEGGEVKTDNGPVDYLDMSNQFIIPLLSDGVVEGIVVVSISLEVSEDSIEAVNRLQPKIRDKFLQVLFNHANNGGFSSNFTEYRYIRSLKEELLRNAIVVTNSAVTDVLILDLVRQ